MSEEIRVVELFAGVGGFRCGLEKASKSRFNTIWANQWEPGRKTQFAFDCYNRHFSNTGSINVNEDINLVKDQIPKEFELLVGGFPCQDYSVATTKARGIQGKKGVLWWNINDILKEHAPRYVLLENVDRLIKSPTSQRGRDFGIILRCLADRGYTVEWRVINAADYGFVQKRRRIFIFAIKNNVQKNKEYTREEIILEKGFFAKTFPCQKNETKKMKTCDIGEGHFKTLQEISDDFEFTFLNSGCMRDYKITTMAINPISEIKTNLESILVDDAADCYYEDDHLDKWRELKGPKRIIRTNKNNGAKYVYSEGGIPFPDKLDSPGRTMLTSEGTRNRSSHLILDPKNNHYRILTPIECERMNGFEDGWTEGMSERQRYFTMGNALVVGLIEKMGKTILELEDQ